MLIRLQIFTTFLILIMALQSFAQSFPIEQSAADKAAAAESMKPKQAPPASGGTGSSGAAKSQSGVPSTTQGAAPGTASGAAASRPLTKKTAIRRSRDSGIRYGFGVSYGLYQSWIFSGGVSVGNGSGYSAYINLPGAPALNLDVRYLPKNSIGFIADLNYDLSNRNETGGRYGTADASAEYAAGNFSLAFTTLSANVAWRGGNVYYPVGLNYNMMKMSSTYYSGSLSAKGGLGWNIGLGAYLGSDFVFEAYLKSLSASFSGTGTSTDSFDKGSVLTVGAAFKYVY